MHICLLRHAYFPDDPRERKQVSALIDAGHEVDVICLRREGQTASEQVAGAAVHRLPLRHVRAGVVRYLLEYATSFSMMFLAVNYWWLRKRFDVIQISTMPDALVFAAILPKLFGARILLDLHEPTPELWTTKYGDKYPALYRLQVAIEQRAIRFCDQAITVTKALRQRFIERGADGSKLEVVPNVCDETVFRPGKAATTQDGFLLITHGSIEERYGHRRIIEAIARLRREIPEIQLDILGDGDFREALQRQVRDMALHEHVSFVGYVGFSELLTRLNAANVGIIAMERSPYSELVDTNKMYEYIALRKPVIASRLPALEANFDDQALHYFAPGDSEDLARTIRTLYFQPHLRDYAARNAYHAFSAMSWGKVKHHYVRLFEALGTSPTEPDKAVADC